MAKKKVDIVDKLKLQALEEIRLAREYKRNRIKNWNKNEDLYYGRKRTSNETEARSTVAIAQAKAVGFVNTILSKIDNPLVFKYKEGEIADMKRAKIMNALREREANKDRWNFKDLLGKKQGVIYGRSINLYYASNEGGYKSHLEVIDAKDFLVDPGAGGYDIEQAKNLGWYNVKLSEA